MAEETNTESATKASQEAVQAPKAAPATTPAPKGGEPAAAAPLAAPDAGPSHGDPVGAPKLINPDGSDIERKIHAWLVGHIAGGPIGRHTEHWNALQEALPALARGLETGE